MSLVFRPKSCRSCVNTRAGMESYVGCIHLCAVFEFQAIRKRFCLRSNRLIVSELSARPENIVSWPSFRTLHPWMQAHKRLLLAMAIILDSFDLLMSTVYCVVKGLSSQLLPSKPSHLPSSSWSSRQTKNRHLKEIVSFSDHVQSNIALWVQQTRAWMREM